MRRAVRPSQVYRLPTTTRPAPQNGEPAGRPGRRRWTAVALVAAAVLVVAALLAGGPGSELPPLDVGAEDQAIAALTLYAAQAAAVDELAARPDPTAPPGPDDAARRAEERGAEVAAAARLARGREVAHPAAAAYWGHPEHDVFLDTLRRVTDLAGDLALLVAVHDTLYAGGAGMDPAQAEAALVSRFTTRTDVPGPLAAWSDALLAQLARQDAAAAAAGARNEAVAHWQAAVAGLQPAAVEQLVGYLELVPDATLDALGGHPVAGPALERLTTH